MLYDLISVYLEGRRCPVANAGIRATARLAAVTKPRVAPRLPGVEPFELLTRPSELQREAFRLLGVRLR